MSSVYIALGSNMGERLQFLRNGKLALARKLQIIATSPVYDTEPIGGAEQDRFLNAVLSARTELSPQEVLALCLETETANGRVRDQKNAPRTLDLDVLLYDGLILYTPTLALPHPRMYERAFVLAPLADIAPETLHPTLHVSVQRLLERCEQKESLVHRTDYSL